MAEDIMKRDTVLPEGFTGVFSFTNWSDTEFVGRWGSKDYHYPANSTSPMVIPEHSPLEIQWIRKKFARDLAEREYFKSKNYELKRKPEGELGNRTMSGIHQASTYTLEDLKEGIQKCLQPLEVKQAFVEASRKEPIENKLTRDEEGNLHTQVIDKNTSLRAKALAGQSH